MVKVTFLKEQIYILHFMISMLLIVYLLRFIIQFKLVFFNILSVLRFDAVNC